MIYLALHNENKAKDYFTRALSTNPHFHVLYADVAARNLREIKIEPARCAVAAGEDFFALRFSMSALLLSPRVMAHPMGNFSINHYAALRIDEQQIELRYVIDMAEIPTFQEIQQGGFPAEARDQRVNTYVAARAAAFARGLQLMLGGTVLHLRMASESVIFPPGAAIFRPCE